MLYVRVIDPYTIELYANQTDATSGATTFGSGSVCDPAATRSTSPSPDALDG